MKIYKDPCLENLFFFRYVGLDFPEIVSQCKHEEKERLNEEIPFKGNKFFIETFFPERRLENLKEWKEKRKCENDRKQKILVFIGDVLGHFVTFFCNCDEKSRVILLDTTESKYLDSEVTSQIFKLIEKVN